MRSQRGATFITWVAVAGIGIFMFLTGVKILPMYLEFYTVQSLINEIARNPESVNMSKQEILSKVDDFLNVNGINTLQKTDFSYEAAKANSSTKVLGVKYEVKKPWVANLQFLATFQYSAEIRKASAIWLS